MRKKVLMSTMALLVLTMMLVLPATAKTVEPYESHIEMELMDPGIVWFSEEGIMHLRGAYWAGTEEVFVPGGLGTATFEEWYNHLSLDPTTGDGTLSAKWRLTFPEGSIEGSARGRITEGYLLSGTFVGTHGSGDFAGVKKMGTFDGMLTSETTATAEISGIIVYP
jgi:hypothetical protein